MKRKNSYLPKTDKHKILLIISMFAYICYFTFASFLRHDNFYSGRYDLGNMVQTVWNTSQGRFFLTSDDNGMEISRLAYHADFLLVLLVPFYMLFPTPKLLLMIQTVILALGCLFVYKIAHSVLRNKTISLAFSLSYLLNPSVGYTNLYDFHAAVLATTFLLACFYFIMKRRYWLFAVFALLSGISKEQLWIVVAFLGLYIVLRELYTQRQKGKQILSIIQTNRALHFGLLWSMLSLALFYILIWHVIPSVRGDEHFALAYYKDFGDSPTQIVWKFFTSPGKVVQTITSESRLSYLKQLFLPLGFLSLGSPLLIIFALPDLAINLLSNKPQLHQIYYQYTSNVTPFLFISAIYGVRFIRSFFPKISLSLFVFYLLGAAILGSYLYGPLPYSKRASIKMFSRPHPYRNEIANFLRTIPQDFRIAASNNLGAHLSERRYISTLPEGVEESDMVIFLLSDSTAWPSPRAHKELSEVLMNNPNYILVKQIGDDFLVFQKKNFLTRKFF